jgi:hypothetical protein
VGGVLGAIAACLQPFRTIFARFFAANGILDGFLNRGPAIFSYPFAYWPDEGGNSENENGNYTDADKIGDLPGGARSWQEQNSRGQHEPGCKACASFEIEDKEEDREGYEKSSSRGHERQKSAARKLVQKYARDKRGSSREFEIEAIPVKGSVPGTKDRSRRQHIDGEKRRDQP